ncbi:MAG TPA: BadF/BadG/BcrA/BcrD ATPase family protein [Acidobacteriaceae bacterium]|nr:BadF/BadG/BcrA/BcrD ATPase family protein [Acidobacteriaceae bacterium]
MPYFLAIDAGGTHTRALLADEHRIFARVSTGSIKLQRAGESEATSRLASMLQELSTAANIPLTQITRTCIGLAGITLPAVRAWATRSLSEQVSGELLLLGDEEIALDAAFPGAPGILLIAGTGSHAIARAPGGTLHRAGGHGPILGDEGGGFWIGLEALRAALSAQDSRSDDGSASALLHAIRQHWNLASLPELIELGNRRGNAAHPVPDFASLAPVVAGCAADGNAVAIGVLHRAGEQLAQLIHAVADKIAPASPAATQHASIGRKIPVAFTGSVLEHIPAVRTSFASTLARTLPAAPLSDTPIDPLDGALYRARRGGSSQAHSS